MSKTSELLAARMKIFNTREFLLRFGDEEKTDVCVQFLGADTGRGCRPRKSHVYSPTHETNPKAPWYDYGMQSFVGKRAESLPKALQWASERYGIALADWVPDPMSRGSYVPRVLRNAALAALKECS